MKKICLTNVYNMSFIVNHDIAIVPVFDLKQKTENTVAGHTSYEIAPRRLKRFCTLVAKRCQKIFV